MVSSEQYEYMRLLDAAVCVGQRVNFYGVVREYDQPKKTRGSDFICTMTVEDMSFNSPGLRVLVFSSGLDCIPKVKSIGDVIRFHRVSINIRNSVPQAIARMKRGASFLLFDGADGVGHAPYQISSRHHTLHDYDRQILDLIRTWIKSQPTCTGSSDYVVPISGIKEGSYFDLCCRIVAVDNKPDNTTIMYVWDGTDTPPACMSMMPEQQGQEIQQDPGEVVPGQLAPMSRDILQSFPCCGTVLAIVPDIPAEELPLHLPETGSWVKFRNLTCRVRFGIYEAVFVHESKISLLPPNHELVKKCERMFKDRVQEDMGCTPQWCPRPLHSITVTDHEHVTFSTLREVLVHKEVTHKFRCLVRVMAIVPSMVKEFCVLKRSEYLKGPCNTVSAENNNIVQERKSPPEYVYRIRLTLEDPTGRIYAYLSGEDADHFFNGHPAADLQSHSATVDALQRKVNKLLGFEECSSYGSSKSEGKYNPPYIKCCLKSYYLKKEKPWESRHYRIFGTTLPG